MKSYIATPEGTSQKRQLFTGVRYTQVRYNAIEIILEKLLNIVVCLEIRKFTVIYVIILIFVL